MTRHHIPATHETTDTNGTVLSSTDLRIHYTYTPGCDAQTYGPAERCHPAEDAVIELAFLEREECGRWVRFDRPLNPRVSMEAAFDSDLYDWAAEYLNEHADEVEANECDLAAYAAEFRAEMRAER